MGKERDIVLEELLHFYESARPDLTRASSALRASGRAWLCWAVFPASPLAASDWFPVTRWAPHPQWALAEAGSGAAAASVAPRDDIRVGPPLVGRPRPLLLLGGIVESTNILELEKLRQKNLSR